MMQGGSILRSASACQLCIQYSEACFAARWKQSSAAIRAVAKLRQNHYEVKVAHWLAHVGSLSGGTGRIFSPGHAF
jgi:hypothetical protein